MTNENTKANNEDVKLEEIIKEYTTHKQEIDKEREELSSKRENLEKEYWQLREKNPEFDRIREITYALQETGERKQKLSWYGHSHEYPEYKNLPFYRGEEKLRETRNKLEVELKKTLEPKYLEPIAKLNEGIVNSEHQRKYLEQKRKDIEEKIKESENQKGLLIKTKETLEKEYATELETSPLSKKIRAIKEVL